jgi:hypothetical protein
MYKIFSGVSDIIINEKYAILKLNKRQKKRGYFSKPQKITRYNEKNI